MIGRGNRGFDFLGYFIKPDGILPAVKTIKNFTERITRLYEQGADNLRIECYVRRWLRWVKSGVNVSKLCSFSLKLISLIYQLFLANRLRL